MIICRECKKELDETNFSKSHLKRKFCKKCAAEYNKLWRTKNKEYDKERKIVYSKNNQEKKRDRDYRYDRKDRARYLSRSKIRWATRTQKIKRPTKCDMCGCTCKPDGHHPDYSKPLDVLWLCKDCHLKAHNNRFAAYGGNFKDGDAMEKIKRFNFWTSEMCEEECDCYESETGEYVLAINYDAIRARVAELEVELEAQKQLYAAHIGDEHDNCGIKINQKLKAENERLRKVIYTAPHTMGCQCLQGGPTLPHWGKIEFCDCWKKAALEVDGE